MNERRKAPRRTRPPADPEPTPAKAPGFKKPAMAARFDEAFWNKLYRALDSLTVTIDLPTTGETIPFSKLSDYFLLVQNNRSRLDRISRKVERKIGEVRRALSINTEMRRVERAELMLDPSLHTLRVGERDAIVERMAGVTTARIASLKATLAEFEAAHRAISTQRDTLEAAKQSLNAIKSLMLEHRE